MSASDAVRMVIKHNVCPIRTRVSRDDDRSSRPLERSHIQNALFGAILLVLSAGSKKRMYGAIGSSFGVIYSIRTIRFATKTVIHTTRRVLIFSRRNSM